jgi:hypothetical protein
MKKWQKDKEGQENEAVFQHRGVLQTGDSLYGAAG